MPGRMISRLKPIFNEHKNAGTLDAADLNTDGKLDVWCFLRELLLLDQK
jgi:hypothetical protein